MPEAIDEIRSSHGSFANKYSDFKKLVRSPKAIAAFFTLILASSVFVIPAAADDADDDGVANFQELGPLHQTHWQEADSDGDGLNDGREIGSVQFDPLDPDTDDDQLNDSSELRFGSNASLSDTDDDGLSDYEEFQANTDPTSNDPDRDGLSDPEELEHGTNPFLRDSDGDTLRDGRELELGSDPLESDTDQDMLGDGEEVELKTSLTSIDTDGDNLTDLREAKYEPSDPLEPDTDSDGLNDWTEVHGRTLVNVSDTDADGLMDGPEFDNNTSPLNPDTDNDSLSDGDEVKTHATNPLDNDTDADYLLDGSEISDYQTDPLNNDTDGDTLLDGFEVKNYSTDPLAQDTDNDSLSDAAEVEKYGTNASLNDTDGDGLQDPTEVHESVFDATNPNPLSDSIRSKDLTEKQNKDIGILVDYIVKLAHSSEVDDVNSNQIRQFSKRACDALDIETTGVKMTALDNFKQAGLYQVMDLMSEDMGHSIASEALRGRLRQAISYGATFSGVVALSDDLVRLKTQACNLVDENPDNDDAALIGTALSAGILALDAYLLVQTGGTVGSSAIYKGAFKGTGAIAAKTGLARIASVCSWKCVGGMERLMHWSLRTALDTGKSKVIAAVVKIGYYDGVPLDLKGLLDGLTNAQIRELLQQVTSLLTEEVLSALREAAQAILNNSVSDLFHQSQSGTSAGNPQFAPSSDRRLMDS